MGSKLDFRLMVKRIPKKDIWAFNIYNMTLWPECMWGAIVSAQIKFWPGSFLHCPIQWARTFFYVAKLNRSKPILGKLNAQTHEIQIMRFFGKTESNRK